MLGFSKTSDDSDKFNRLYEKYSQRMIYLANSLLLDWQDAEDAVHDAFLSIAKNMDTVNKLSEPEEYSYFLKAARNSSINILAKRNRTVKAMQLDEDVDDTQMNDVDTILENLCRKETIQTIVDTICSMKEIYRVVLYLFFVQEKEISEIALLLGRKEETVRQQLHRGKQYLIKIIIENEKK